MCECVCVCDKERKERGGGKMGRRERELCIMVLGNLCIKKY